MRERVPEPATSWGGLAIGSSAGVESWMPAEVVCNSEGCSVRPVTEIPGVGGILIEELQENAAAFEPALSASDTAKLNAPAVPGEPLFETELVAPDVLLNTIKDGPEMVHA